MKKILFAIALCLGLIGVTSVKAQAAHSMTISFQDTSCTTAKTCTAQIYRFTGNCPSDGTIGSGLAWVPLTTTLTGTASTSTTTWTYTDTTVVTNTTYCVYATATYTTGSDGPSVPSNTFQGTIPGAPLKGTLSGVVN